MKQYATQPKPNGKAYCVGCGSRHEHRALFTASPPVANDVLCQVCEENEIANTVTG